MANSIFSLFVYPYFESVVRMGVGWLLGPLKFPFLLTIKASHEHKIGYNVY